MCIYSFLSSEGCYLLTAEIKCWTLKKSFNVLTMSWSGFFNLWKSPSFLANLLDRRAKTLFSWICPFFDIGCWNAISLQFWEMKKCSILPIFFYAKWHTWQILWPAQHQGHQFYCFQSAHLFSPNNSPLSFPLLRWSSYISIEVVFLAFWKQIQLFSYFLPLSHCFLSSRPT